MRHKHSNVLLVAVGALALTVAIPLYHYHIFVFKNAAKDNSIKYKLLLIKWFPFSEENSLKEWEEKIFKGKVVYKVEKERVVSYVRATSSQAASALYYKIKMDARRKHPVVSWKWNVQKFPTKKLPESLGTKDEDDFAARVYVIFPAIFFTNSKVLEYVWAEVIPEGT